MNEFKDRFVDIPASFQQLTGALRKVTIKTKTKILADGGDDAATKAAAQAELARLILAIERVAQPVIAKLTKLDSGAKMYQLEFYVEHADAFKDVDGVKAAVNVATIADPNQTFDVDAELGENIF